MVLRVHFPFMREKSIQSLFRGKVGWKETFGLKIVCDSREHINIFPNLYQSHDIVSWIEPMQVSFLASQDPVRRDTD